MVILWSFHFKFFWSFYGHFMVISVHLTFSCAWISCSIMELKLLPSQQTHVFYWTHWFFKLPGAECGPENGHFDPSGLWCVMRWQKPHNAGHLPSPARTLNYTPFRCMLNGFHAFIECPLLVLCSISPLPLQTFHRKPIVVNFTGLLDMIPKSWNCFSWTDNWCFC